MVITISKEDLKKAVVDFVNSKMEDNSAYETHIQLKEENFELNICSGDGIREYDYAELFLKADEIG